MLIGAWALKGTNTVHGCAQFLFGTINAIRFVVFLIFVRIQTEENVAESQWNNQKYPGWNSVPGTNHLSEDS